MSLLQMSFTGGVLIAVIVLIRAVTLSRLPKRAFLALWAVALARLLIPFSLPSTFSVYTYVEPAPQVRQIQPIPRPGPALPAETAPEGEPEPEIPVRAIVWGLGAGGCFLYFAISYWRCRREFQTSLPVEGIGLCAGKIRRKIRLRQSDRISAPLTYGVVHPVILMPKNTDWNNKTALQYVLAHELVHIRRFDALTKLALAGALCIHWFNPLVWVMYLLANRDLELSCDEAVVRQFGLDARKPYALTLIGMEEQKSGLSGLYSCFNKNAMEERITAIMRTKKWTIPAICAALALVVGVAAAFATSAMPGRRETGAIPGFTAEENGILQSIWFDGYEERTVAEYRDEMRKLQDDPETRALFRRLDGWLTTEEAGEARRNDQTLNEFVMLYQDLYRPLLFGGRYTYSYGLYDTVGGDAPSAAAGLEFEYKLNVIHPEILTVRNYNDARLDVFDGISRVWDSAGADLKAIEEESRRLTEKWTGANMTVSIDAVLREGREDNSGDILGELTQDWDQLLAPYLPFGLRFEFNPAAALNGCGLRMTYQGYEVRGIVDGETWITESAGATRFDAGSVELFAVRDAQGNLTGLRLPTEEENSLYWNQRVWTSGQRSLSSQFYEDRGEFPMELSDEELEFLRLTVPLSREENYRMIQSVRTGGPEEVPAWTAAMGDGGRPGIPNSSTKS